MKTRILLLIAAIALTGCKNRDGEADAYGNFEATEVIVSAETGGRILELMVSEGTEVEEQAGIAVIDTTLLHLQKAEIDAGMKSVKTKILSIDAQNDILKQQIENININIDRIANMLKDSAATKKQYDDLSGQVAVLQKQIAAANTQKSLLSVELAVLESNIYFLY